MSVRNRLLLAAAAALGLMLVGCNSGGSSVPGSLNVHWSQGQFGSCDGRHLVTVKVMAEQGGDVVAEASGDCAGTSGTVTIDTLAPGNYDVVVQGVDSQGRATYQGTSTGSVHVPSGGPAESDPIELALRPANLVIDWDLNMKCSKANVDKVEVHLADGEGNPIDAGNLKPYTKTVGCDYTHTDPDTGDPAPGVLFTGLDPTQGATTVVYGLDAQGDYTYVGRRNASDKIELVPGQTTSVSLQLQPCTGGTCTATGN